MFPYSSQIVTFETIRIMVAVTITVKIPLDGTQFRIQVDSNDTVETVVNAVRVWLDAKKVPGRGGLSSLQFPSVPPTSRPFILNRPEILQRTLLDVGIVNESVLAARKS